MLAKLWVIFAPGRQQIEHRSKRWTGPLFTVL